MKQFSAFLILILLLSVLLIAIGCGGDDSNDDGSGGDGDSDGDVDLSVDENIPASELTSEQAQAVCSDIYDAVMTGMEKAQADIMDYACLAIGVGVAQMSVSSGGEDADIAASCAETVTSCENGEMDAYLEEMTEGESITEEDFCESADEDVQNCDATAGEIANCMVAMFDAQMAAMQTYLESMPECADLTAAYYDELDNSMDDPGGEVKMPAVCAAVEEKCPDMFEEMNSGK